MVTSSAKPESGRSGSRVPHVTIGVVTYRRPNGLAKLLGSIGDLRFRGVSPKVEVIVVDNDTERSAAAAVETLPASFPFKISYVEEPRKGISFARNRVIDCAEPSADFVAFIDDDEFAEVYWLDELLSAQIQFDADIVAGPVVSVFPEPVEPWREAFFQRRRLSTGTALSHAGSGNVLISTSLLRATGLRFREGSAHVGGEDTRFFLRLTSGGARMVWADDAVVYETVPVTRTTWRWTMRRAFRSGTTWSSCELELASSRWVVIDRSMRSLFRILQGMALLTIGAPFGKAVIFRGARYLALGAGQIAGMFGATVDEYKQIHGS